MCGFAGVMTPGLGAEELARTARSMAGLLAHRGPDDSGDWTDPESGVGLGFRRLAILDLSEAGHQPMVSASGRFVVVYNGEIYNHDALRGQLRGRGYAFRGSSDTEVLVNALDEWGPESAVPRFRGMFAFAAWDRSERALWLGRDRLGIKPLYLYDGPRGFAFASELRAFQGLPGFDRALDEEAISLYLRYLYIPAPLTPFARVRKVLPGTLVRLRPGGRDPRETRFWSLSEIAARGAANGNGNGKGLDAEEAVDALYGKLSEAIRLRTHADVPVGAFLSGGVDSSTVVALMQEQSAEPIRTFTIGFGGREGFDESGIASAISERLGTVHTTVRHDPGVLLDVVPDMGRLMDEPIADPSIIPTYLLSRVTREHVVVALSGDGGDEVFGGYNRYFQGDKLIRMNLRLPFPVRRTLGRMANRIPSAALGRLVSASVARQRTMGGQQDWRERWAKVLRITGSRDELAMYRSLLSVGCDAPPVRQARAGAAVSALPADAVFRAAGGDLIDRMMLHDQLEYLPDDLLAKVDRASMAVSLEVRVPLLDHEVVEFAWRLPGRVRRGQSTSKWLLREIASRHIPREILDRPKMGFTVPIADWVQGELRPWGDDIISTASPVDDVLDMDAVRGLWRSTAEGGEHLALGAWALLVLKSWSHDWQASPSVAGAASLG